jgi:hypothetical protein
MRWLVYAFVIAGCDQGERTPPPARVPPATAITYGADSFIELEEFTISDIPQPMNSRRIKVTGNGTLVDEREQQATSNRTIPPRRFAELVRELKDVGFLTLTSCGSFDHGRHTTLTLNVPEERNKIGDATMCNVLREPIRHIRELTD